MLSVLFVVLPIFALIFAGWGTRRMGVFGPQATGELNRFVVYLALPALLFDIVAKAQWSDIWQPGFVGAFTVGMAVVFAATLGLRLAAGRGLADAAIDGLNAGYANTGFMGFPLTLAAIGPAAQAPTLAAAILTVCVLFAVALVLLEVALQAERHPGKLALKVGRSLARNPLLVAPLAGGVFLAFGIALPAPVESFLKLLGGAASPAALVALGLFLAERREGARVRLPTAALLVGMKLLAQPLVTWIAATLLFRLDPATVRTAVLLAALPTGTGPFMVAEFYRREAGITSRTVLVSTVLSVVTVSLYLSLS